MSTKPVTVSEVSALIAAREEARAELMVVFEHWCELEAQAQELERRFERHYPKQQLVSEARLKTIPAVVDTPGEPTPEDLP